MSQDHPQRPGEPRRPDDVDRTESLDLGRTQELSTSREGPGTPSGPGHTPPGPAPMLPPADPWGERTAYGQQQRATPSFADYTATPQQNPYAAPQSPYAASAPPAAGASERPVAERRRGPGWLGVLLIAGLAALLAGLGGGLLGGWLGATDRLDGLDVPGPQATGPTPEPGAGATERPEGSVANIAAKATPSVVTIRVSAPAGEGTGSGWVLDDKGHIVTNNHVVSAAAKSGDITVVLANGKQSKATIVGRDVSYDLAVLKVDRTDLTPLPMGESSKVVVGDAVIAVGAPLGLDSTVTTGIVSALNRPVTPGEADDQSFINAIQTDAAINPGNSGGPLLDMEGRVIGVNSAIARVAGTNIDGQSGNIGVGFAIPSDQVKITVDQLIRTGKAEHPIIGVLLDRQFQGEGVRIAADNGNQPAVTPGGPADKAGLEAGDVITQFEGKPVTDPDALVVAIRSKPVGATVTLTVVRDGKERDVKMVLQGQSD
ncbi:putative serine protease PepD [Knoellia remsis]|uniref:Putative serine protease PepD n=1 Tax=Knoellia remsis TaxID=407159 RepID=A0A2T0UQR5_9MICO|nr:trypsin-like peptidase domain-containing protein [Knoellia remsis]PRY60244.1 putative serine protease PepD [Knoellia remsis]